MNLTKKTSKRDVLRGGSWKKEAVRIANYLSSLCTNLNFEFTIQLGSTYINSKACKYGCKHEFPQFQCPYEDERLVFSDWGHQGFKNAWKRQSMNSLASCDCGH